MKTMQADKVANMVEGSISTEELDKKFDAGEDIDAHIDWANARRPNLEPKRVNVDFPTWMVNGLDRQSDRLGITRQALIKLWIAERLDRPAPQSNQPLSKLGGR